MSALIHRSKKMHPCRSCGRKRCSKKRMRCGPCKLQAEVIARMWESSADPGNLPYE